MGRDLQKRKARSSRPTTKQPSSNRPKRIPNPLGNDIIARNWDKNLTTAQNYRRLGLISHLKAPTGGIEPGLRIHGATQKTKGKGQGMSTSTKPVDPFAIKPAGAETLFREARVERDEEGKIVRVIDFGRKEPKPNPLNDPLNDLDTDPEDEMNDDGETWGGIDGEGEETTEVVKALEAEANRPVERKVRGLSAREKEWLESLIERHGEDTRAMFRDRRLNPMQQTEADIARRIRKLKGGS
ncbi:ribosome biogenesis protein Nop16 [Pseudomassariella vexata]|uniref:Nucleolar protein 16 n=1 Tax=Pseudomassariella vexata TaxID=1141098 RepID=A0A1Y2EHV8_9PEZI|nr:ribosome biogenesis protein Nop16 [Pseudomassariella vexata]ORY71143.1 ribosome biogenesis protein Nop16 [Pseudomassariella vexata]